MPISSAPKKRNAKRIRRILGLRKKAKIPNVFLLGHVFNEATREAFLEVGFRTEGRKFKSVRLPKEIVRHHPARTRDSLSRFDAALPKDQKATQALMTKLAEQDAPRWRHIAPKLGWRNDGAAFVLHDRVLGEKGNGTSSTAAKLVPPDTNNSDHMAKLQRSGSVESWKEEVAQFSLWSSPVALSLCAAFAAPLLNLVDWPTFMVVLHGTGKVGKSTAALAGASVIGIGLEELLPNWNLTPAKLPEVACCFNDMLLVLNGLESTTSKENELREFLRRVTYMLGDGIETGRHSSWSAINSAAGAAKWRTIVLVTSELSFDVIAMRANQTRLDGERARCINVEATVPNGTSIIDTFPRDAPIELDKRGTWARVQVEALRAACARQHGVVLEPYLQHLMGQEREALKRNIIASRDAFVGKVTHLTKTEALNHAAKNFGLIYAGGVQAIRAGLLPLTEEKLLKRIRKCFKRSVSSAATAGDSLILALRQFDEGLRAATADAHTPQIAEFMAIKKCNDDRGTDEFTVHVTGLFSNWFGHNRNASAKVLRWLCDEGLLDVHDREAAVRAGFTINSVRHTRRIKGKNSAAVVFRDPRARLRSKLATEGE